MPVYFLFLVKIFTDSRDQSIDLLLVLYSMIRFHLLILFFPMLSSMIMLAHDIIPHHHPEDNKTAAVYLCLICGEDNCEKSIPEHEHKHGEPIYIIRKSNTLSLTSNTCAADPNWLEPAWIIDNFLLPPSNGTFVRSQLAFVFPARDNPERVIASLFNFTTPRAPPAF